MIVAADLNRTVAGVPHHHVAVRRPTFASIGLRFEKVFAWSSHVALPLDRIVHRHQLGAVRKRRFHLHFVNHLRDAVHHVVALRMLVAQRHDLGHGFAVARPLQNLRREDRDRLRIVELQAARAALPRHLGGDENQQPLLLARGEVHSISYFIFLGGTASSPVRKLARIPEPD